MICELKIMAEHVTEAIKTLPTVHGIEYFIEVALAEATIVLVTSVVMGATVGIIIILISVLIALLLSYYSAKIECEEAWKRELFSGAANYFGKEYFRELIKGGN